MATSDRILFGIKGLHATLSIVAGALSATLIKKRLIPEQLEVIGTVGVFFIIVALLLTLVFWSKLKRVLVRSMIVTLLSLILLTFIQIQYVVTVNIGQPDEKGRIPEHHLLIGYKLTEYGHKRIEPLGANESEKHYIEWGGYTEIPLWYGASFTVMKAAYAFTYMLFTIGVVITEGGLLRQGGHALVSSLAPGEEGKQTKKAVTPAPQPHAGIKKKKSSDPKSTTRSKLPRHDEPK